MHAPPAAAATADGARASRPHGSGPHGSGPRTTVRRLLLRILLLCLLPLAILATLQGLARLDRDSELERQRLADGARLTAETEQNALAAAEPLLALLAASSDVSGGDPARCQAALAEAAGRFPAYSHFSRIDSQGRIVCASHPAAVGRRVTDRGLWQALAERGFAVSAPLWGQMSGRPVIWAMLPVSTADGRFDGAMSASVDVGWLQQLLASRHARADTVAMLVDGHGRRVTASRDAPWDLVPLQRSGGSSGVLADVHGRGWSYATAPLFIGDAPERSYHIVYARPDPLPFSRDWWFSATWFAIPVLALVLATLAIWVGANRAILSWVGRLGGMARRIGEGEYRLRDGDFDGAPDEIRQLAADLHHMARAIGERDRALTVALARQRELVMELHHRVRNNLQLLASFAALEAGGDGSPALERMRRRIEVIAMVHRRFLDAAETGQVPLAELLAQCAAAIGTAAADGAPDDLADIDAAVPLALWIAEAAAGRRDVRLEAAARAGRIHLRVSWAAPEASAPTAAAAERLLHGLGAQLGGRVVVAPGSTSLDFPASALRLKDIGCSD